MPTQDAVDLPKMVQVVRRFLADELLDGLPSAYLVDPIALPPPYARDRLQQSQVALAQRPKDPCRVPHPNVVLFDVRVGLHPKFRPQDVKPAAKNPADPTSKLTLYSGIFCE